MNTRWLDWLTDSSKEESDVVFEKNAESVQREEFVIFSIFCTNYSLHPHTGVRKGVSACVREYRLLRRTMKDGTEIIGRRNHNLLPLPHTVFRIENCYL